MSKPGVIASIVWLKVIRRKDVYVLLILLGASLIWLTTMNVFGLGGTTRYLTDTGLLLAWILGWILAINVSTRELPGEELQGTIYTLLAKPISRAELIAGKWLGATSVVCAANLVFYILIFLIVTIQGGTLDFPTLAQGFALHCAALAVMAAIGTAFSTRMNYDAAATMSFVLTGACMFVVPRIPEFAAREQGVRFTVLSALYHIMPHFEILDLRRRIVHDFGPVGLSTFMLILFYTVLLVAAFLMLAWLSYRKKQFSRGDMM